MSPPTDGCPEQAATRATVGELFRARSEACPDRTAVVDDRRILTYRQLGDRVQRTAELLLEAGLNHGDRVAILSENRAEYMELILAAAQLGVIAACQNWRLGTRELTHCLQLVEPGLVVVSGRFRDNLSATDLSDLPTLCLDEDWQQRLDRAASPGPGIKVEPVEPEDPLLILYTSGTTGLPKGAVLSHRAELARSAVFGSEYALKLVDTYAAWAPFYHMAATEPALSVLLGGGQLIVVDGFDPDRLAEIIRDEPLGWLLLLPGMLEPLIETLRRRKIRPRSIVQCGAMPDLIPAHQIAEITKLLDAPFVNTFASTECGLPPASAGLIPVGQTPTRLSKLQSAFCAIRLVDQNDEEVPTGVPGEVLVSGPTLFSGYWQADGPDTRDFHEGWFHTGDVLRRNPDGTLDFVDRAKYLIKSGGENIYPAEIEHVLLGDPRVAAAVVVRRLDPHWGEVPVAVVSRTSKELAAEDLFSLCERELSSYKKPREIHFVPLDALPRSTTGKIQRGEVEGWVERTEIPPD